MNSTAPFLVNIEEVQHLLGGVSRTTIHRLVVDEGLPNVKIRSRLLFPVDALRAWIAAHTCGDVAEYAVSERSKV